MGGALPTGYRTTASSPARSVTKHGDSSALQLDFLWEVVS